MMDPHDLYPNSYHPVKMDRNRNFTGQALHLTRTEAAPRYYIVDFGISRRYQEGDLPVMEDIINGGDKSAPEHQAPSEPFKADPFPTDVYYIGNMLREDFLQVRAFMYNVAYFLINVLQQKRGFEFLRTLVESMVRKNPAERPTMREVANSFAQIRSALSVSTLRARVANRNEFLPMTLVRDLRHRGKQIFFGTARPRALESSPQAKPSTAS
jgi:hypothetical protein